MINLRDSTLVIILAMTLSACQQLKPLSPVARNFDKISTGTSKEAVVSLLGEPDEVKSLQVGFFQADLLVWKSFLTGQTYIIFLASDNTVLTTQF